MKKDHKIYFKKPSKTHQSFKEECDINSIMKKYEKTGILTHVQKTQGHYGDFSNITDYHQAHNQIIEAQNAFMSLPARVRAKFNNDPGQFVDFVENQENAEELVKMGLAIKKESPQVPDASQQGNGKGIQEEIKGQQKAADQ